MLREFSAGALVLRHMQKQWWVAVIEPGREGEPEDRKNVVALPKGNVDAGEKPAETALREVTSRKNALGGRSQIGVQKRARYRTRFPTRGRRRAAKTSARLRTTTVPAAAFARYTATFRPVPVADGKTTLSIPSEIQMAANSWETE